jgi:hypothetical protein
VAAGFAVSAAMAGTVSRQIAASKPTFTAVGIEYIA